MSPRGHYTRSEALTGYFKAMMWYGRMGFRLRPGSSAAQRRHGRDETRRALLIVSALAKSDALELWDRIYQPTAFFVGASDDLTVHDYLEIAALGLWRPAHGAGSQRRRPAGQVHRAGHASAQPAHCLIVYQRP